MDDSFKILALDGGGARGLFIVSTLKQIEERYNIKYYEYFDLIIGTSTGSIIAAALSSGIDIDEVEKLYIEEMDKIFKKDLLKNGIIQSKYDNKYLEKVLKRVLKNKTFENVKTDLMITTTNIVNGEPVLIKNKDTKNMKIVEAILASCAAPVFFDPLVMDEKRIFTDGGLWANNPSLAAISEALSKTGYNRKIEDIKMLSIGTGEEIFDHKYENKQWGIVNWAMPLIKIVLQLNSKSTHNIVSGLLSENQYVRLDYHAESILDIDTVDKDVQKKSKKAVNENKEKLNKFFEKKAKKVGIFQRIFKKKYKNI